MKNDKFDLDPKLIEMLKKTEPNLIAKELCEVQPIDGIDFEALAKSPLWDSFVKRHFDKDTK